MSEVLATTGYGLIANVLWDRALRISGKVYLLGWHGDYESVYVWGLSKHGPPLRKYLPMKRLYHIRAAWFPPRHWKAAWCRFATKAEAQAVATGMQAYWSGVQCFTSEHQRLRPGISVGEAATRWGLRRSSGDGP